MDWLAGETGRVGAQQISRGRIRKADEAVGVESADAVGYRVEQNLLLAVELLGAVAFVRAGKHLSQRSGDRLDSSHRLAILAEAEVAVKLQDSQNRASHADRNCAAGD